VLPFGGSADQFEVHGLEQFGLVLKGCGKMEIAVMAGLFAKRDVYIEAGHAGWGD